MWYIWILLIGDYSYEAFEKPDGSKSPQNYFLKFLFIASAFIIKIHLLNMLIAIMANTFSARNKVHHLINIKDKLLFIVENWYLVGLALRGSESMKYIICAFETKTEDEEHQKLLDLMQQMKIVNHHQKIN